MAITAGKGLMSVIQYSPKVTLHSRKAMLVPRQLHTLYASSDVHAQFEYASCGKSLEKNITWSSIRSGFSLK